MSSAKKALILLGGIVFIAIVGIGAVFAVFVKLAAVQFTPGAEIYLRDVYVVIDQTLSMAQGQRREARDMLKEEILREMGPGDRIFCYRIGSDFRESSDRVFASSRDLPKIYENVTAVAPADLPEAFKSDLRARWERFSLERAGWLERLDNLDAPPGNYSDYLGTLEEIARRINSAADPNLGREKWLIVLGDLKHEPVLAAPPVPGGNEKRQFDGVHIHMVYPGGIHQRAEQERIERFWKQFFAARGAKTINFISYDGFIGHFPRHQAPGPEALGGVGK